MKPTTDLRGVMKGVLADHLRIPDAHLEGVVFPDSKDVKVVPGLIRSA